MSALLGSCWTRRMVVLMAVVMGLVGMVPNVDAGFIPNSQSSFNRQTDMENVQKVLESKLVYERLAAMGYSQSEIQERLAALSDQELHRLSAQIDTLVPAGDGLGLIISVLVIVILIIVILQLTNHRIVVS